jgi:hypothetical protein
MASVPSPPPGNMTVPPTFGWEDIATVLLVVSVVAVAFLLIGAAAASLSGRSEWQGYLGARTSSREPRPDAGTQEDDVPVRG